MQGDLEKVMDAGFNGYITKPIVPEQFVSRTEEFLKAELRSGATWPPAWRSLLNAPWRSPRVPFRMAPHPGSKASDEKGADRLTSEPLQPGRIHE